MFLNRSFWPDVEATGQLLTELCEDLGQEFEPIVIAGQPSQNIERSAFKVWGFQQLGQTQIKRVWHTRFPKRNLLGRLINQVTFMIGCLLAALCTRKVDVVVLQTDPPMLCLLGWILRLRHRCKMVAYLQDVYPDIAKALGKVPDGTLYRLIHRIFYAAYRHCQRIVVLSDDMKTLMLKSGIEEHKLRIVPNWIDASRVYPEKANNSFRIEHGLNGHFLVMYSGNLGLSQRLETLIDAAYQMQHYKEVLFAFVGDGASKLALQKEVEGRGLTNVRFFPYQPKEKLATSLSAADLHVVPIDARVLHCLMPSKLYGVLASGTPALVIAPEYSELARIVQSHRIGITVPDVESIAWAIEWAYLNRGELAKMGHRGRQLALAQYDRLCSTERFAAVLRECLIRPTAVPHTKPVASPTLRPAPLQEHHVPAGELS